MDQLLIISSILLWIFVLINLLLTFALIRRMNIHSSFNPFYGKGLDNGKPAPSFTALALNNQEITLSSYKGISVAFIFVAPHCQPCYEKIPEIKELALKAKTQGVEIVLVADSDIEKTKNLVNQLDIKLSVLSAPRETNPFLDTYKVDGTPFFTLIDTEGVVLASGFLGQEWQNIIQKWMLD